MPRDDDPGLPDAIRFIRRDWLNANHLLLRDGDGWTLIDSGYGACLAQTLALLESGAGLDGLPLRHVINTHCHSDHMGGNAGLGRRYGCRISVPAGEAPLIERWDDRALWLEYADTRCEPFAFDAVVQPGEQLTLAGTVWEAIAAPGHDMGALVFHCAEHGILVTGDALWETGFGVIEPGPGELARLDAAEATLDRIARLPVALVIPGHGAPFRDIGAALERAYRRVEALRADPLRMARNAVKSFFGFKLMELGSMALADVPGYVARVPFYRDCNERHFRLAPDDYAQWLVGDMKRAGAIVERAGVIRPTEA